MRIVSGVGVLLACVTTAHGQADVGPPLPGAGRPTGTSPTPPAREVTPAVVTPVTASPTNARLVDRRGPVVLGGFIAANDAKGWRLDVWVPLGGTSSPALRLGAVFEYSHDEASIPSLAIEGYSFALFAGASYDWKLPLRSGAGDFVALIEGGLGTSTARIKIDRPFMPGTFENYTVLTMRMGAAFQFRARAGWVISVQPVGFLVPLSEIDESEDQADLNLETETNYELSLLGGYQF